MIQIAPEIGPWPYGRSFPRAVQIGGRNYVRTNWEFPYSHTLAQYREDRPERSRHLHVLDDGNYIVDHIDEANPDFEPVWHLLVDVIEEPARWVYDCLRL